MRLAIITTHPIQYYAPVFKLLNERKKIRLKVFYTWGTSAQHKHDPGFGKTIDWDLPLLNGYDYEWLENTSTNPGSHHFKGIVNPNIIDRIKSFQPNAILVFGWAYSSHLKVLRHFKGKVPVWFRGDSTLLDERPGVKAIMRELFLKWVYKYVDRAFYAGVNNKAYFKKYGLNEQQLTFAPHAIDNERFEISRDTEVASLKAKLDIKQSDITLLFSGKLESKKAPVLLLEAFINLNKPNVHIVFVGDGDLAPVLKTRASGRANVHFLGFQNQQYMPIVYQLSDLFCLPSKGPGETWGLAVNEAMACGKAILVSDKVGCAADLVQPGKNGLIFKNQNVTALTEALEQLIGSKQTLAEYGARSKQIIKSYNFEQIAQAIETECER